MSTNDKIEFTHLHVHSEYSLLDGSAKIKELVARAKELGMDSLALTDHGSMFGVINFYKAAKAIGIKPVLGCEVYVASGSRFVKENRRDNFYYHLVLLAENLEGYHNLVKLVSFGYTEGFYYKPRIDIELLRQYHGGLIALSACLAGPVPRNFLRVGYDRAKEEALLYQEIFGEGNFFLELQDHGLEDQKRVNEALLRMHEETGIELVCTNDCHYINAEDAEAHEILLCIQTGKTMQDEDRMIYEGGQFFLKSPQQMLDIFPDHPEALTNTHKIAERCNVEITFHEYKLPKYDVPQGRESYEYLKELCYEGLKYRYGEITAELEQRLLYELEVINDMGFCDYFLITWDFIKYAKDNDIPVGPGRGSAAGCLVAYCLRITNIDPIRFGLLFERFLNPERISMPDIDIDFCYERRQEVIDYVVDKYGADHVAQIITFGTLGARGVIRDVGRAIGMSYSEVDTIAKMIPFEPGVTVTIDSAMKKNGELRNLYHDDEHIRYLIDMSKRLEGLPRHSSTHAAGVVICNEPVYNYVPLNQNDGVITTQFPMVTLEELGLLKMDFLGLRTLTVIQSSIEEIKRRYGVEIDLDRMDYNDPKVYDMIAQGKTEGVFQLESAGMTSFIREMRPSSLEDWTAAISLYRPGPMDIIPLYVACKHGTKEVTYAHPKLKPILEPTYGCIVYQEQVMEIVRSLAGYSFGRADLMRRAMSKKKADVMAQERQVFIYGLEEDNVPGCIKNGVSRQVAEQIFDEMTDFAKYAFNKSHAACYAVIGYQTAWLKLYYPTEFMAALMTSVMDNAGKIAEYINECRNMGVKVMPPDINDGYGPFTVSDAADEGKPVIRFGLNAIKNVGRPAAAAIVAEREKSGRFISLNEFVNRMDTGDINKRCIESLIKAGAFDSLGGHRSQYRAVFAKVIDGAANTKRQNMAGQVSLFDLGGDSEQQNALKDDLPAIDEMPAGEKLAAEKEVLGIYVSGHPAQEFANEINACATATSLSFVQRDEEDEEESENMLPDGANVVVGGIIEKISVKYTRNNQAMSFLTIEDFYGAMEVIVFPKIHEQYSRVLREGMAVIIEGRVSRREEENGKIIANSIKTLKKSSESEQKDLPRATIWLKISKERQMPYQDLMQLLSTYRGDDAVIIYDEKKAQKMRVDRKYYANSQNDKLMLSLKAMLGDANVVVKNAM